jgi:hypothetical protein
MFVNVVCFEALVYSGQARRAQAKGGMNQEFAL